METHCSLRIFFPIYRENCMTRFHNFALPTFLGRVMRGHSYLYQQPSERRQHFPIRMIYCTLSINTSFSMETKPGNGCIFSCCRIMKPSICLHSHLQPQICVYCFIILTYVRLIESCIITKALFLDAFVTSAMDKQLQMESTFKH